MSVRDFTVSIEERVGSKESELGIIRTWGGTLRKIRRNTEPELILRRTCGITKRIADCMSDETCGGTIN
jgi:hypothetical protein